MKSKEFWAWFDSFAAPRLSQGGAMSRDKTFRKMFEHLDGYSRPVNIIETGCMEDPDNWAGNGCSTTLFHKYVSTHPASMATSIEIDVGKVMAAEKLCPSVFFRVGDSIEELRKLSQEAGAPPIDLLYLDASHHDWVKETPSQAHHFNELMAIMPLLNERSLVAVDDSAVMLDDYPQNRVFGKGGMISQYALEIGAKLEFLDYQVGFTRMTGDYPVTMEHLEEVIGRARACVEAGEMLAADRLYRLIMMATRPPYAPKVRIARGEAAAHFGRGAHKIRKYGMAIDWFKTAIDTDMMFTPYRCEMATALVGLGALPTARREAIIATKVEPENPGAWATLGGIESDMQNEAECIAAYDQQIKAAVAHGSDVDISNACINRAVVAVDTNDYAKAQRLCDRIIALGVHPGDAWHILAIVEYRLSRHEKAIDFFDLALANNARNVPLTHWNKALPLEAIGRLKEAGIEKAWNEKEMTVTAIYIPQHRFALPKWRGQKGPGTIHVHTEAGHGDNISMFRYFPLLKEMGLKVNYECDPTLISLTARCFPDVTVIPRTKDYPGVVGMKECDCHIPIGDLIHAFGTDIDTIPWNGPYLWADPALVAKFAERLPRSGRKIGLCWSSGIRRNISIHMEKYGKSKSMLGSDIAPLINGHDNFISLQVGDGRAERDHRVLDVLDSEPDWDATAALIANLDLVITVDTGVAHLAGAMGVPTWVVMQKDGASWHFMCERPGASWNQASPWYPSIRVFRQKIPGQWAEAVEDVVRALNEAKADAA
jgi:hypothetical protein